MTVLAVGDVFGIAGRRPELVAALEAQERAAATEPGCLRFCFAATIADPDRFLLVGEWSDQSALDAHFRTEAFATYQLALDGLLAKPSSMTIHSVSASIRPVASGVMDPRDAD